MKLRTSFFSKKSEFTKLYLADFPNATKKEINAAFFAFIKWVSEAESEDSAEERSRQRLDMRRDNAL